MQRMTRAAAKSWLLLTAAAVVCSAQSSLSLGSSADAARVISLTGQVTVLHDSQPWALNAGDLVKLGQAVICGPDGFAVFEVSDGSRFEVYANSQVIFRKTPGNLKDLLDVMIGRVRVHIQKWAGQPNYNRVFTPTAVISVRGTVFDVEVEGGDATTLVIVEEGLVEVQHARHPGAVKLLGAGQWLRVYRDQPLASARLGKGTVLSVSLRAIADAVYTAISRQRIPGIGGTKLPGGGVSLPGDTGTVPPVPPTLPGDSPGDTPAPPPPPPGN